MKNKKNIYLFLLLIVLPLIISCNNTQKKTIEENDEDRMKKPRFSVNADDVLNISIYHGEKSGELSEGKDMQNFCNIINSANTLEGSVTDNLYRRVEVNMKDGSVHTLLFGGDGFYFVVEETFYSYKLNPSSNTDFLRALIERAEIDYSKR